MLDEHCLRETQTVATRDRYPARVGHVDDREVAFPRANDVKLPEVKAEVARDLLHHPVPGIPGLLVLVVCAVHVLPTPVPAEGAEQPPILLETSHVAQMIAEACSGLHEEIVR